MNNHRAISEQPPSDVVPDVFPTVTTPIFDQSGDVFCPVIAESRRRFASTSSEKQKDLKSPHRTGGTA